MADKELGIGRIMWGVFLMSPILFFVALNMKFGMPQDAAQGTVLSSDTALMEQAQLRLYTTGAALLLFAVSLFIRVRQLNMLIVRLVLCEAAAMAGFYFAFMTQSTPAYFPYAGISILGMLISFPRRS